MQFIAFYSTHRNIWREKRSFQSIRFHVVNFVEQLRSFFFSFITCFHNYEILIIIMIIILKLFVFGWSIKYGRCNFNNSWIIYPYNLPTDSSTSLCFRKTQIFVGHIFRHACQISPTLATCSAAARSLLAWRKSVSYRRTRSTNIGVRTHDESQYHEMGDERPNAITRLAGQQFIIY